MRRSVIRDRRGVTEIGRKSEGSLGCFVFACVNVSVFDVHRG